MDPQTLFLAAARFLNNGQADQAAELLRQLLAARPDLADAALLLALALRQAGNPAEAETVLARALDHHPGNAELHNLLGVVRLELGRPGEALDHHREALRLCPDLIDGLAGMGNSLAALDRHQEAADWYQRALQAEPDNAVILSNLGAALKNAGQPERAVDVYRRSLVLAPGDPDTLVNLGNAFQDLGDMDSARLAFEQAVEADPECVEARWGLAMAHIPMTFDSQDEIEPARQAYSQALDLLDRWIGFDPDRLTATADRAAGCNQPFYLAYHGANDRDLQSRYGALLHRVMVARHPECAGPLPSRSKSGRFRLGLASGYFCEHSVWKIPLRGWLAGLDRERFEVHCFHTSPTTDQCTEEARTLADHFTHQPHDFPALVQAVRQAELDGLLFPEIGMDPVCAKLAALRLAPVQAVGLGHPMTTGLPTMDAFLSSALMEPEDGEDWYTEQLVRLPNLGILYEPVRREPAPLDREDFGLRPDDLACFCPQSLFKYQPRHDRILPAIAARVDRARFVFLDHRRALELTHRFQDRLGRAFAAQGLDPDRHLLFLPSQPPDRYLALAQCCDLFLDSLGWAGFNTAMEAAGAGLPLITCPQGPMRGRHGGAVAQRLGLDAAMAHDEEEYVELAVRAGLDNSFRAGLRDTVLANRDRLYNDQAPIRALEQFLLEA